MYFNDWRGSFRSFLNVFMQTICQQISLWDIYAAKVRAVIINLTGTEEITLLTSVINVFRQLRWASGLMRKADLTVWAWTLWVAFWMCKRTQVICLRVRTACSFFFLVCWPRWHFCFVDGSLTVLPRYERSKPELLTCGVIQNCVKELDAIAVV